MAKRKSAAEETLTADQTASEVPSTTLPESPDAANAPAAQATAAAEPQLQGPVQAPEKGPGDSYTIDNRIGYRKEVSPDGRKRQIRFADRPGGQRPDDEILAPVRDQKPAVSWNAKEKAWQARKTPDGLEAIDGADQKLAELGRKREGQER